MSFWLPCVWDVVEVQGFMHTKPKGPSDLGASWYHVAITPRELTAELSDLGAAAYTGHPQAISTSETFEPQPSAMQARSTPTNSALFCLVIEAPLESTGPDHVAGIVGLLVVFRS